MIHRCTALVVPARLSEAITAGSLDIRQGTLRVLVNGALTCVAWDDWHVYLNAENKVLRSNPRAVELLHKTGLDLPPINGTAIFLGRTADHYDTDAPAHLIRLAEELFDIRLAAAELV